MNGGSISHEISAPQLGQTCLDGLAGQTSLPSHLQSHAADLEARARSYESMTCASSTKRAYAADWDHFKAWCEASSLSPLPASVDAIRYYLTEHDMSLRASTLGRRLVAISREHQSAGFEPPTRAVAVQKLLAGIRRAQSEEGLRVRKVDGLALADLQRIAEMLFAIGTLSAKRDRALLLIGWAGGFRRGEIRALNVGDVTETPAGLVVYIARSKTDQEGKGKSIGIPRGTHGDASCPAIAYREWLQAAGIRRGAIFRGIDRHGNVAQSRLSTFSIARIVQESALMVGLDPARFAGHSLRRGLITEAHIGGASDRVIMKTSRHKSAKVLGGYIDNAELFKKNAATIAGL